MSPDRIICDSRPCFSTPLLLSISRACQRRVVPVRTKRKLVETFPRRATVHANIVILGGSSGVGKEAARYLESKYVPVKIVSRRTGYDFRNRTDTLRALAHQSRAAISVGSGRGVSSSQDEVNVYKTLAQALSKTPDLQIAVVVLRSLVLPEVLGLFQQSVKIPWVLLRPGPLVDKELKPKTSESTKERVLVTSDIRCNGLVSRAAVGRVVGDLLLGKIPVNQIESQVFGVYDLDRMINHPQGIEVVGADLWQ